MSIYKNLFIVERKKMNALNQRILNRYNVNWGKLEPFSYYSGEDLIILAFSTNLSNRTTRQLHMSEVIDSHLQLVCNMKLLYCQGIFKLEEFNTNLREFIPFTMATLKIMLSKLYKNPQVIWHKNIDPFIIVEAHKKGLVYNFSDHLYNIKNKANVVLPKIMTKVIGKIRPPQSRYLTWDRLIYIKQ